MARIGKGQDAVVAWLKKDVVVAKKKYSGLAYVC